jgi:hypothetical protein
VRARSATDFWGFWMLGGMSGGGMGFIFDPEGKPRRRSGCRDHDAEVKRRWSALPFAMEPVVYDFAINERGTWAELLAATRR